MPMKRRGGLSIAGTGVNDPGSRSGGDPRLRGMNPGRFPQLETMRHWITSFRLWTMA
jgi:hypothetical protein